MQLLQSGQQPVISTLTGGVSSDIVLVDTGQRMYCVKRALPKLKVQADWRAPVERNHWEVEWMRTCAQIDSTAVPAILGEERESGIFAMEFLAPSEYPLWKRQLSEGVIESAVAQQVGQRLARIHAATARSAEMRDRFATDHIFLPIRIEPYLLATAAVHRDCAPQLIAIAQGTAHTKLALVHGDVSPKNILIGKHGPVFLDAECAWYGDPAFDLAFCLNHLLLKCLWRPRWTERYLACFQALFQGYCGGVTWESQDTLQARASRLLPGLFLARVDGKSPVEYITESWQRDKVREVARTLLRDPVNQMQLIQERWRDAMTDRIRPDACAHE